MAAMQSTPISSIYLSFGARPSFNWSKFAFIRSRSRRPCDRLQWAHTTTRGPARTLLFSVVPSWSLAYRSRRAWAEPPLKKWPQRPELSKIFFGCRRRRSSAKEASNSANAAAQWANRKGRGKRNRHEQHDTVTKHHTAKARQKITKPQKLLRAT